MIHKPKLYPLQIELIKQFSKSSELAKLRLADKAEILVPLMVFSEVKRMFKHKKAQQFTEIEATLNVYEHARFSIGEFLKSIEGKQRKIIDDLKKAYYPNKPRLDRIADLLNLNLVPHVFRVWFEFGITPFVESAVFFQEWNGKLLPPRERTNIDSFREHGVDSPITQRNIAKLIWKLNVSQLKNIGVAIKLGQADEALNENEKPVDRERIMPTLRDLLFYQGMILKTCREVVTHDFSKLGIDSDEDSIIIWSFVYYNAGIGPRSGPRSLMVRTPDKSDRKGGPAWLYKAYNRHHIKPVDLFNDSKLLAIAKRNPIRYAKRVYRLYTVLLTMNLYQPSPFGIMPPSPPGEYPANTIGLNTRNT